MSEIVKKDKFRPLELNERNVQTLFNRCLPTDEESKNIFQCYQTQVLIPEITGRTSQIIPLLKEKVDANKETIRYLLGQIESFHSDREVLALQEGFVKYDGTIWTQDYETLFKLYHLALSSNLILDFSKVSDKICSLNSPECVATLSPKDPNYQEWFSGYEAKVKKKTLSGQEPADD